MAYAAGIKLGKTVGVFLIDHHIQSILIISFSIAVKRFDGELSPMKTRVCRELFHIKIYGILTKNVSTIFLINGKKALSDNGKYINE